MNKQLKTRGGVVISRGIQWTDFSWNVISGCKHRCRWTMPDGSIAICYAEETAHGVARAAYPRGFANHYYNPDRLTEPAKLATPSKIFCDSMSDLFGSWVPEDQLQAVFEAMREAPQHTFQSLTKYAPRLLNRTFPPNLWVGCSSPPDSFMGHNLSRLQQEKMLHRAMRTLAKIDENVTWMSVEPISWDVAPIIEQYKGALDWVVIGAATNGAVVYQPNPEYVRKLIEVLDRQKVPVFMKGNLRGNPAADPWREFFPNYVPSTWNEAPLPWEVPLQPKKITTEQPAKIEQDEYDQLRLF